MKFAFIALCFIITLLTRPFCFSRQDWRFLSAGMFFTVTADFFLLICFNNKIGTAVFCFAHAAYVLRCCRNRFCCVSVGVLLLLLPFTLFWDTPAAAAMLYALLFGLDLVMHIRHLQSKSSLLPRTNRLVALCGLSLFALCDINVLFFNLPQYTAFPAEAARIGYALIWVFYAPAQVLLSVSALRLPVSRRIK